MEFAFHCRMGGLEQAQRRAVWGYMCACRSQVRVNSLPLPLPKLLLLPSFYKLRHQLREELIWRNSLDPKSINWLPVDERPLKQKQSCGKVAWHLHLPHWIWMQEYIDVEPRLLLKAYSMPHPVTAHLYAKKTLGYSDIVDANLAFQQLKREPSQD